MPSAPYALQTKDPRHKDIVDAIRARRRYSENKMSEYHERWRHAEDQFVSYVNETDLDAKRRSARKGGDPKFTTIHVPQSYAMLMAAHTFWTSVFLGRNPVFQHMGRHGESDIQVQSVDALMDYQVQVGGHLVPYYIWLLDPGRYGVGVLWSHWAEETVWTSQIQPDETGQMTRFIMEIPGYQGNKIFNVEPWDYFPDPRVPIGRPQDGEFVGRRCRVSWNTILKGAEAGQYFNVAELGRHMRNKGRPSHGLTPAGETELHTRGSENVIRPTVDEITNENNPISEVGFLELHEFVIEIVPRLWKLGDSTRPEKWVFTVAEDTYLIGLRPHGAFHNKFPVSVLEYEPDGYALVGDSLLNRSEPLNDTMNWLLNSHFYNVRASLSNQFVYDPTKLYEEDLLSQEPGLRIRLRPEAYGQDVRTMISQFPVQDVTRQNIGDLEVMNQILQRVVGVNDNLMGVLNQGGRKTATEVRSSNEYGISRLKTAAEFFSAQGWGPLDQMLLSNTQQYYSQERVFRIAGDTIQGSGPFTRITPESIQGFYDFIPVDGTMPIDKMASANLWRQMLLDLSNIPQIAAQYNLGGIFEFTAQLAGLKGIKQFKLNVLPDEQLSALGAAGNVVPIDGARRSPVGTATSNPEAPEPRRLPQTGRTQ